MSEPTSRSAPVRENSPALVPAIEYPETKEETARREGERLRFGAWLAGYEAILFTNAHRLFKPSFRHFTSLNPVEGHVWCYGREMSISARAMTIFEDVLLVGMSTGVVVTFNIHDFDQSLTYRADRFGVSRILTGLRDKPNSFFVFTWKKIIEFRYNEVEKIREVETVFPIIAVLTENHPIYVLDSHSILYEFLPVYIEGMVLLQTYTFQDTIYEMEDLRIYCPVLNNVRPVLATFGDYAAVLDLGRVDHPDIRLWRKCTLPFGRDVSIKIRCCEFVMFAAAVDYLSRDYGNSQILAFDLHQFARDQTVKYLYIMSGVLRTFDVTEDFLVAVTSARILEVFDARGLMRIYHITVGFEVSKSIHVNGCLIMGTDNGGVVSLKLPFTDLICLRCNEAHDEEIQCRRICVHYVPEPIN